MTPAPTLALPEVSVYPLSALHTLLAHLERVYDHVLPQDDVWRTVVRATPGAEAAFARQNLDATKPPSRDTPTPGDGMTVRGHLQAARTKLDRPPRLAVVGGFSTGKSTLLNALMHCPVFDKLLAEHLKFTGKLLHTGEQPTTGNVTELEFVGLPTDSPRDQFRFHVTYLTDAEMKALVKFVAGKLELSGVDAILAAGDWAGELRRQLLPHIQQVYDGMASGESSGVRRQNLIALAELIEAVGRPEIRQLLASGGVDHPLGGGDLIEGMKQFRAFQSRPVIEPPTHWASVRLHDHHAFHAVKAVRMTFPHPDFDERPFSVFDFPGLAAGRYRDDFISHQFLPEANVILVTTREGAVGGEAVRTIVDLFANRRAGMKAEALLDRIFFVRVDHPKRSPSDPADQMTFFRTFLMMARELMHPLVLRSEAAAGKGEAELAAAVRPLYAGYLSHFLGCDAKAGGFLRSGEAGTEANESRATYERCKAAGCFRVPTDPATLDRLASAPELLDQGHSFPLLARLLNDSAIAQTVRDLFARYEDHAGVVPLIDRIREFVRTDAPRVTAEDVAEHLRQAAAPLRAVREFRADQMAEGGVSLETLQARQTLADLVGREQDWRRVLDLWGSADPGRTPDEGQAQLVRRLEDVQLEVEKAIRRRVDEAVTARTHYDFLDRLGRPPDTLRKWVEGQGKAADDDDGLGGDGFGPVAGGLLAADHSLVLYRYFVKVRKELLGDLHGLLLGQFLADVRGCYQETVGHRWRGFNDLWQRALALADPKVEEVKRRLGPEVNTFLKSADGYTQGEGWYLRRQAEQLVLPRDPGRGKLYDERLGAKKVRLGEWAPPEAFPTTGEQLAAWLARARVLPVPADALRRRDRNRTLVLPDFDEPARLRVLVGVGLLAPDDRPVWAKPDENFWDNRLPALIGRREAADELLWNPVPFNPYAGPYGPYAAKPGQADKAPWVSVLRLHLTHLLSEIALHFVREWRRRYLTQWQVGLEARLLGLRAADDFWRWVDDSRDRLMDVKPLQGHLLELDGVLREFDRHALFTHGRSRP